MLDEFLDAVGRRDWQESGPEAGTIRFAHVGLGWWTQDHVLPALAESALCETNALVSGDREKAERLAADVGAEAAMTYDEYHDGAAADAYDAVYVCTPNATHRELVETAARLDKPVLCEKPMAATVEGAERLVAACDDADVPLMVAYRMQTDPAVRRARELIAAGAIGDVIHVHGHMSDDILEHIPDPDQWRLTPDLSGGATVNDIGIYPLNTTRFVLDADPVAVYGTTAWDRPAFEGQDEHTTFQLEFPGSVRAACTATHGAIETGHLRILGTDGELVLDPLFFPSSDTELTLRRDGATATVDTPDRDQMREEFDYFADCLLSGRDPHPDGQHGLVDMRAIAAVYRSAESGERVVL